MKSVMTEPNESNAVSFDTINATRRSGILRKDSNRQLDGDRGAVDTRDDIERPGQAIDTFPHTGNAHPRELAALAELRQNLRRKPRPSSQTSIARWSAPLIRANSRDFAPGMPVNIRKALLNDPESGRLHLGREARRISGYIESHFNPAAL